MVGANLCKQPHHFLLQNKLIHVYFVPLKIKIMQEELLLTDITTYGLFVLVMVFFIFFVKMLNRYLKYKHKKILEELDAEIEERDRIRQMREEVIMGKKIKKRGE